MSIQYTAPGFEPTTFWIYFFAKMSQLTLYKDVFIFPPMEEDRMEMVPTATTTTSDDVIGIRYNRQIVSLISNLNVCILCN